jgi:hypothetical protein
MQAQLIIAVVLGFTMLAVVLYLFRRPGDAPGPAGDAAVAPGPVLPVPALGTVVRTRVTPPGPPPERPGLRAVQRVRCGASPRGAGSEGSLCDPLPSFEQALAQAIRSTVDCAPKASEEGTINYVLVVDFHTRELRVYPGRSGTWKGPGARKAADCVRRALPPPPWDTIVHQHRWYMLAALATYPPLESTSGPLDLR